MSELTLPVLGQPAKRRAIEIGRDPLAVRLLLLTLGLLVLAIFVLTPLANLFSQAFGRGLPRYLAAIQNPNTISAIGLTVTVAAVCVFMNLIFGVAAAWAVSKFDFPGKSLFVTLIDLPFSVSPVISGLIFILMFGAQGYLGPILARYNLQVVFAPPGIILATLFVTVPFIARSLIPAMEAAGREYEEAAITLGASGWQAFWHVTIPNVRWGLIYGVLLCNARAMGEFGAVSVISGKITGRTDTVPLRVEKLYAGFDSQSAFAVASLLAFLALVTLFVKSLVEWRAGLESEEQN